MNVHQLSIAFLPEQDRLLVRINTQEGQELQFWFTRRLTLGLSPLLGKVVADHVVGQAGLDPSRLAGMDDLAKRAVAQFQRGEPLRNADFTTPYKTSGADVPLFASPLLVTEVNIAPIGHSRLRMGCAEKLSGGADTRSFQMDLSEQLVHAFVHLLERALKQSQWRDAGAAAAAIAPDRADSPAKPGYLN
jgi:hypothetical protein